MSLFKQRMKAIVAALDTFEALLTAERPADFGPLVRGRVDLSRAVTEFFAHEGENVSKVIAATVDGPVRRRMEVYRAFIKLRSEYSQHVIRWDSTRLASEWTGYRRDCQALIRTMRTLLKLRSAEDDRAAA